APRRLGGHRPRAPEPALVAESPERLDRERGLRSQLLRRRRRLLIEPDPQAGHARLPLERLVAALPRAGERPFDQLGGLRDRANERQLLAEQGQERERRGIL